MIPTEVSITELAAIVGKTRNQIKYMVKRGVFGMTTNYNRGGKRNGKIYVSAKEIERLYPEEWRAYVFDVENAKYRKTGNRKP